MAVKQSELLTNLITRRTPVAPGYWTPQSGAGPVQPAYGRPQQARLPQNRLNQVMPGSGNVGATFGTTIPKGQLTKYYRNIEATLDQMIVKIMWRVGFFFQFTITASDQDYLSYQIGAQVNASGDGRITLKETLVQDGKKSQEKLLPYIQVVSGRYSPSGYNIVLNSIIRRYGILLANLQTKFSFSVNPGNLTGKIPTNVSSLKPPKTAIGISNQTIKMNLFTTIGKLITSAGSEQFILNATEADYLRYVLNATLDANKTGLINVKEDFVKNGAMTSNNRLINPPIRVVNGVFNPTDFNKIFNFISNNYQKLINITRYHTVA